MALRSNSSQHRADSLILWILGILLCVGTYVAAFWLRLQEWASWQDVEYRLGSEMLLATNDAYHWVAGAEGFEFGVGHPMSELLRLIALILGTDPASVAFWLPPILTSLLTVLVLIWAWSMKNLGFCAGILTSLAPGFLARTLLGYADTDLITLFLPLLISLAPACWVMRFLHHPLDSFFHFLRTLLKNKSFFHALLIKFLDRILDSIQVSNHQKSDLYTPLWILLIGMSGLLSWWAQEWHSLFPYLVRFNGALLGILAFFCACHGERKASLLIALCYILPALEGWYGFLFPIILFIAAVGHIDRIIEQSQRSSILGIFWILAAFFLLDQNVLVTMIHHVQVYLKPVGDAAPVSGTDTLLFPSITRSVIEIQDLSFSEMRLYFHPWSAVAMIGLIGFMLLLCIRSGAFFLLPLAGLAFLSAKMGGRMVMFGAPIVALGLTIPFDWIASLLGKCKKQIVLSVILLLIIICLPMSELQQFWENMYNLRPILLAYVGVLFILTVAYIRNWHMRIPLLLPRVFVSFLILIIITPPLVDLIPAMTEGPSINRRHADALRSMRSSTPADAMIWLWWDWGYAAHHFARRHTIANGAENVGPFLFLPATVFATDNPRYARQIIKYTAAKDNFPPNVFKNKNAQQAQDLIDSLKSADTPFIQAQGKQYLVVTFDMLDLGFWITTFGKWDFQKREDRGYAISIVPQALSYRLDKGEVVIKNAQINVPAASIDVFDDSGLEHRDYITPPEFLPDNDAIRAWREDIERRRNVHFLFNRVTGEKLVVDDRMYNTLMVQLLIAKPDDPRFTPYFQLIYDNIFCRVYEVL